MGLGPQYTAQEDSTMLVFSVASYFTISTLLISILISNYSNTWRRYNPVINTSSSLISITMTIKWGVTSLQLPVGTLIWCIRWFPHNANQQSAGSLCPLPWANSAMQPVTSNDIFTPSADRLGRFQRGLGTPPLTPHLSHTSLNLPC